MDGMAGQNERRAGISGSEFGRYGGYGARGTAGVLLGLSFGRMFSYIAGVPLSEYLRRRRMTLAAFDLQNGGRVLDVALRYGV